MSELLNKRMIRKAQQSKGNKEQETAKALIREITLEMFLDIKVLEADLIEEGVVMYNPMKLKLRRGNTILADIQKIGFSHKDNVFKIDKDVLIAAEKLFFFERIVGVMPSLSYVKEKIIPYVEKRGIEATFFTDDEEWYTIRFTIKGEYDVNTINQEND